MTITLNVPERDRTLIAPFFEKQLYKDNFLQMIAEHSSAYEIYFVTFTFKEMKQEFDSSLCDEYFRCFHEKLHTALTNNKAKHGYKKPIMILFPESLPAKHYHGIIAVHKDTTLQFDKKLIDAVEFEYSDKLEKTVPSIRVTEKLLYPYPKEYKQNELSRKLCASLPLKQRRPHHRKILARNKPLLKIADYRIHPIVTPEEFARTAHYSSKHFISSDYTTEDIIFAVKEAPHYNCINKSEDLVHFELQKDTYMPDYTKYSEFLEFDPAKHAETRRTILHLAENHNAIRAIPFVHRLTRNKNAVIRVADIAQINKVILDRSVFLAKQMRSASPQEQVEMLAEQNVLNIASSSLNTAIAARNQEAFDRLSKLLKVKKI